MIVWRVSDFFRFKFCYSSKNRHLSGSHNGTPGDWHALLCRGGNLQSREGSSQDGQSWRGFHHVTYGDIRHVDVDVNCMEYLMPIQWLVAHISSTYLLQILQQVLPKALVTAKFAGLSIPTKKFDPQKDLGLGRSRLLYRVSIPFQPSGC